MRQSLRSTELEPSEVFGRLSSPLPLSPLLCPKAASEALPPVPTASAIPILSTHTGDVGNEKCDVVTPRLKLPKDWSWKILRNVGPSCLADGAPAHRGLASLVHPAVEAAVGPRDVC